MCTVSLIYTKDANFFLTSNRDEAPNREAIHPQFYTHQNVDMCFPMDKQSKGTWVGISNQNRVVCLLNGGFEIHQRKTSYRLSRGVIVKNVLALNSIEDLEKVNLEDIEPFTMVIADWNNALIFKELVFDGEKAHIKNLELSNHIWSSSTLYNSYQKAERQRWFSDFKNENDLTPQTLLRFHKTAGLEHEAFGVIMNRDHVKTTSITQIIKEDDVMSVSFSDLNTNKNTKLKFETYATLNES